jgi:hypothetical protein
VGDRYDRWPLATNYPWADEVSQEVREQALALSRRDRQ